MPDAMLEPIAIAEGESLILQVECDYLQGATYHRGILTLTDERLHFTRQDQPEPMVWETQLTMVQGARVDVAKTAVTFELYLSDFTFRGDAAMHLHVAFAQEYWRRSQLAIVPGAHEGERLLLKGSVSVYRHETLASRGTIRLSSEELRFVPSDGEEPLELCSSLDTLNEMSLQGMKRRLSLILDGSKYQFEGEVVPRLYGILAALRGGANFEVTPSNFTTWKTAVSRGPLLQHGELVCSPTSCRFASTGKLDAFLGLDREIGFETRDVVSVEVKGVLEKRLSIQTEDSTFSFKLPNVHERFTALREVLTESGGEFLQPDEVAEDAKTRIAEYLPGWAPMIGEVEIDEILFFTPAWQMIDSDLAFLGHLCMTSEWVYFIPQGKRMTEEDVVRLRSDRLLPPSGRALPHGLVALSDGGDEVLFGFGRGNTGVASFWTAWRREMDRTGKGLLHPLLKPDADNRREAYRAALLEYPDTYVYVQDQEEHGTVMVKGVFADLSVGGCSILTIDDLTGSARVRIELPAVGRGRVVHAEVVHSDEVGESDQQWRHGIRFLELSEEEILRVRESVMAMQRNSLTQRADLRENTKQYDEDA